VPLALFLALALASAPASASSGAPASAPRETTSATPASEPAATPAASPRGRARLRGRVLVYGSRDPVVGARLLADEGGAETDATGDFELWLPPGEHKLLIRAAGFQDLSVSIKLEDRQDLVYEYRLAPDIAGNPFRTVVRQQREVAVSSTTLRDEELRAVPGSMGDPFRVVGSLPGVSQLAGFLPYVVVRGAAPGNTGYYLDGVRVPILFHVALGPSVIHPYFIDQVDFYASGAPVRLGRYASGIIEGRTRAARRDRAYGEFDVRLTDAGGLVEIPLNYKYDRACLAEQKRKARSKKTAKVKRADCRRGPARGSLTFAGRYSYTAGVLTLVQANLKLRFWDFQARFDHALGKRATYTAFALGSFDELGEKQSPDPFVRFEFYRLVQKVRHELPRGGVATYSLGLGLDRTGLSRTRTNEWLVAPRVDVRIPIGDSGNAEFGAGIDQEVQIFRSEASMASDGWKLESVTQLFNDRVVSATGLYAELLWRKGRVDIRPGIRGDLYAQVGHSPVLPQARAVTHAFGIDPRLLVREKIGERLTLRQNIGVYHQPPSFPIPLPGLESFGFERGLQRNIQGSVGYELVLGKTLAITQDVYLGRLTNLQDYDLASLSSGQLQEIDDLLISATGWSYGLETMARLLPGQRAYGWAAYTLSRSTREYEYGGRAPSSWDQRHIVNLVLGYRISDRWSFGGRLHFHSGRPYTAQIGDQSAAEALLYNRNNRRLPAYFQLDLRAERTWRFRAWSLHFVADILNSTYSSEVLACILQGDSSAASGAGSIVSDSACGARGLRYILPSLGLRGAF
jgi:hypothetical protein